MSRIAQGMMAGYVLALSFPTVALSGQPGVPDDIAVEILEVVVVFAQETEKSSGAPLDELSVALADYALGTIEPAEFVEDSFSAAVDVIEDLGDICAETEEDLREMAVDFAVIAGILNDVADRVVRERFLEEAQGYLPSLRSTMDALAEQIAETDTLMIGVSEEVGAELSTAGEAVSGHLACVGLSVVEEGVPTATGWWMVVLVLLLLAGLRIKFGGAIWKRA